MNEAQIIINNNPVTVQALYYISHNNYYLIYTNGETDENDFIILHIAKILQEVVNTNNGPQPTGYLIGTTIVNDDEYNLVKQDIAGIIDAKQNNLSSNVHFLDPKSLAKLKIRDTKIFRLKKNIFDQIFGNESLKSDDIPQPKESNQTSSTTNNSFEQKYYQEVEKNKKIQSELDNLIEIVNNMKNMLQG